MPIRPDASVPRVFSTSTTTPATNVPRVMSTVRTIRPATDVVKVVSSTPPHKYVTASKMRPSSGMERTACSVCTPNTSTLRTLTAPAVLINRYTTSTRCYVSPVLPTSPSSSMATATNALKNSFGTLLLSSAKSVSKAQSSILTLTPASANRAALTKSILPSASPVPLLDISTSRPSSARIATMARSLTLRPNAVSVLQQSLSKAKIPALPVTYPSTLTIRIRPVRPVPRTSFTIPVCNHACAALLINPSST